MENIIASEYIRVYEAAELWQLYILKFKLGICMLQTNVKTTYQREKVRIDLKYETKGD